MNPYNASVQDLAQWLCLSKHYQQQKQAYSAEVYVTNDLICAVFTRRENGFKQKSWYIHKAHWKYTKTALWLEYKKWGWRGRPSMPDVFGSNGGCQKPPRKGVEINLLVMDEIKWNWERLKAEKPLDTRMGERDFDWKQWEVEGRKEEREEKVLDGGNGAGYQSLISYLLAMCLEQVT